MRILVSALSRAISGGAETYLRALLPHLAAGGHQLALLTEHGAPEGDARVDSEVPGLDYLCVREIGAGTAMARARDFKPDVAFHHGFEDPALEGALLRAFPAALYAHAYYGTCLSGTKLLSRPRPEPCGHAFTAACLARFYPRRCGGLHPGRAWRSFLLQRARRHHLPRFAEVLVASEHMRAELSRHGARSVTVAPYFPASAAPAEQPAPRPPGGTVLFASRLVPLKGGSLLMQALALAQPRLPFPLHLVVVGRGPDELALRWLAQRAPFEVSFRGWLGGAELVAALQEAHLAAVPSVWPEPFGIVGLEAGCYGVPAVAFDSGGIPSWLRPGVSGELAPAQPPTAEGLADAVVRALGDAEHYRRLQLGAWEQAKAHSARAHVETLLAALGRAAAQPPAPGGRHGPGSRPVDQAQAQGLMK